MIRKLVCGLVLAALLPFSGTAAALLPPIGPWQGVYRCAQGETALDLQITARSPTRIKAVFYFHALPANPRVPRGCFTMRGSFNQASGRITLTPAAWLHRPPFFVSVAVDGKVSRGVLSGRIEGPACSGFRLERSLAPPMPAAPKSCRMGQQGPVA
ncbi:MAG TPA: hypothetical protein VFN77_07085 [Acetobacteraceae bacterium]|nr:hypothetical protein [Acetobacteraceae bacterium]